MLCRAALLRLALGVAHLAFALEANAQGLQVSPVSITIEDRADVVRLSNGSDRPLNAQVRVFRWLQDANEDQLVETQEVIASPPFVEVPPLAQQVVRLVRFDGAALEMEECERPYRILVDEIPNAPNEPQQGLQYVLRYSVPVYLSNPDCEDLYPDLAWSIEIDEGQVWLNVANSGNMRAQLARISYVSADGSRMSISEGLLGYVLAGSQRRFGLSQPISAFANDGSLEVEINGTPRQEVVTVSSWPE